MYAIRRLQVGRGVWCWAVSFSRQGKRYERRFHELKYGGTKRALQVAVAWRDDKLAQAKALQVHEFCQLKRSNNTSGIPGVHFLTPARQPEGIWQAKLKLSDGLQMTKSFSVSKYGEQKAFRMAVKARREMLRRVGDRPYLHDPLAIHVAAVQLGIRPDQERGAR